MASKFPEMMFAFHAFFLIESIHTTCIYLFAVLGVRFFYRYI